MQQSEFYQHFQMNSTFGSWSLANISIFETKIQITNLVQIRLSLDYWKGFEAQI